MWTIGDVRFEMVADMTEDPVVTIVITTPAGRLTVAAEPVVSGTILVLRGTHLQDSRPNAMGAANLMVIAQALMERMEFDGVDVEGALRTTGANPGRRPGVVRFRRRVRPPPSSSGGNAEDD